MGTARIHRALREAPGTSQIVEAAVTDFWKQYAGTVFPPLVIVIAALDEEAALPDVLEEIPPEISGVTCRVVVVDDGSSDRTAEVAAAKGALVCRLARNCGHGVALRTGYRLAREGGARYIATLDADGQWDPADLPAMVELLEKGQADFVIGSRQLGRTENTDRLRNFGVRFFSALISVLTGTRITDSSSGLRAMRAEVTERVRQTQPQYQTSELLIGAILQGFRIAEVPTVMRLRRAGKSKKGHNLLYGARYARVIIRTYIRERCARRRRSSG
ncbi:MAG: glycosyltransferase family 2 protein [Chloroflexi bacterium]|nr:glycosyltransferase family 2 protein [Chloroflexota bacterium]